MVIDNHVKDLIGSGFVGMCQTYAITSSDTPELLEGGTVQFQNALSGFHMQVKRTLHAITGKKHGQH
jgi:hypothetical protein